MTRLPESEPCARIAAQALFLGLDIGSTTVKVVALDASGRVLFSRYRRHFSEVRGAAAALLREAGAAFPEAHVIAAASGSGAIEAASRMGLPFVQEVIASGLAARAIAPDVDVAVELGGEDAKLTFFTGGVDQRMNETCAGGTGAFIDQMAAFIHTDAAGLDKLALEHHAVYPIASRCGVFAKTDILPLINEGCRLEDIAASIMQAVVDQTISGLARGRRIRGKVLFLGGPFAFLQSLRERFVVTLGLSPDEAVFPEHAEFFVAIGAALHARDTDAGKNAGPCGGPRPEALAELLEASGPDEGEKSLPPFFASPEERAAFHARHTGEAPAAFPLEEYEGDAFLGVDSGSTTFKAVLVDPQGRLLYSSYGPNKGDPLPAAVSVIREIYARKRPGCVIRSSCATGYGSALICAALRLDHDEVETVAHFAGARFFQPEVSFILDIGGQDIKCLRIRGGAIDRIQLNEACSAGCGSFIETFARSLNLGLEEFTKAALAAENPVDLGTRCTVFMNSKVRQAQKDGAKVGDIAAGLCSSVVRNACYKVMKLSGPEELGPHVSAQGGAFAGDGLLRALEMHLGRNVVRPALAGLMGAFGAALVAGERGPAGSVSGLIGPEELAAFSAKTKTTRCNGCANHCLLTITRFADGRGFVSGNRCERGAGESPRDEPPNLFRWKYDRLFNHYRPLEPAQARRGSVGIPRTLNIYENYPLWFTLFTELGFRVELSAPSSKELFYKGYGTIPSQTVCYPAKLAHGHMLDLLEKKPDALFFPCLPQEIKEFSSQTNHYNCPVVIGYPELLDKNIGELHRSTIPFYCPFLPLAPDYLARRLIDIPLFADISIDELEAAVRAAFAEREAFKVEVARKGEEVLLHLRETGRFGIVLAGHPYHVDPEVHHGIADLVASCGMGVLTEDSVAHLSPDPGPLRVVDQWTYHSRLYRAGAFAAGAENLAVLQLVSFGCGLDAVTSDQVEEILTVKGRLYAQIKIDEGENLGPARIRIRSLQAAMRDRREREEAPPAAPVYKGSPPFTVAMRETHTILIPQLSPMHFQFLETIFEAEGYRCRQLPKVTPEAVETGLRHVHNDACYPAIVVVGQLLQAIRSGEYDTRRIALMISQTGGGCRATNYIAFLRKALVDAGLDHIPIVSFNMDGLDKNPGFRLTRKMLRRIIMAGFYGDALMRITHRLEPYEVTPGDVAALSGVWVERIKENLRTAGFFRFHRNMARLVRDFDDLPIREVPRKPRVGLVGEILLKYHPDANNNAAKVVEREGGEAVVPDLMDFVLYSFHSSIYGYRHLSGSWRNYASSLMSIAFLEYCRRHMRRALRRSKRFTPPLRFAQLRRGAEGLISLGHQTGEGWLLAAEMVELLESGVNNILCMQPFGCLPNHITGKGLLKELKRRYPQSNIIAVDYDPGASEANQINRIKLMMSVAR